MLNFSSTGFHIMPLSVLSLLGPDFQGGVRYYTSVYSEILGNLGYKNTVKINPSIEGI